MFDKKMRTILLLILVVGLIGAFIYWRTRPTVISGGQFAQFIDSTMPRTKVSGLGSFYYNNGSWWQEVPTLATPDGKPIALLFDSPNPQTVAAPTTEQIKLAQVAQKTVNAQWDDLKADFTAYFDEMDDPAKFEDASEWEISVDGVLDAKGWSISTKVPGGDAAWYSKDFEADEGSSVYATY